MSLIRYNAIRMEKVWHIEPTFGCQFLSQISTYYPNDVKVLQAAKRFMFVAMRAYTNALKHVGPMRPRPLKGANCVPSSATGNADDAESTADSSVADSATDPDTPPPPPTQPPRELFPAELFEFLEGCNAFASMPETKKRLKDAFVQTRRPPHAEMIAFQESVWEMVGVDPAFGAAELGKIGEIYADKQGVMMRIQQWMVCMQLAGREVGGESESVEVWVFMFVRVPTIVCVFMHLYLCVPFRQ